jgi:hypothetical protein
MGFGTWNVRNVYRAGSLAAAARELARYKLDLVGVQEVRWGKGDKVSTGIVIFICKGKRISIGNGSFVHRGIVSAFKMNVQWDVGVWTGSSWLMIGTGDGFL